MKTSPVWETIELLEAAIKKMSEELAEKNGIIQKRKIQNHNHKTLNKVINFKNNTFGNPSFKKGLQN